MFLCALVLFATLPIIANASRTQSTIQVYVDHDQRVIFDVEPVQIGSTTMVQFRPIFEALGIEFTWNNELKTIWTNDKRIGLTVDQPYGTINNTITKLQQPPTVVNNVVMIPLRFVAEATGANVNWYSETRKINIIRTWLYNTAMEEPELTDLKENTGATHSNSDTIEVINVNSFPFLYTDTLSNTEVTLRNAYQSDSGVVFEINYKNTSRDRRGVELSIEDYSLQNKQGELAYISDSRENSLYTSFWGLGNNTYSVLFKQHQSIETDGFVLQVVLPRGGLSEEYRTIHLDINNIPISTTFSTKIELLNHLKQKYSELDTDIGIAQFNFEVFDDLPMFGEDYRINVIYNPVFFNDNLTETTKSQLKDYMYRLAMDVMNRMPNKKLIGSFNYSWYLYPNLKVGVEQRTFFSWNNFYYGDVLDFEQDFNGGFRWYPYMDDAL